MSTKNARKIQKSDSTKQPNALPGENGDALREEHKKMTTFSSKLFACFLYALCFY